MEVEIKPIPNHPGYFASNCGKVFSIKTGFLKELKLKKNEDGYLVICLSKARYLRRYAGVHRVVMEAWVPKPDNKTQVNHKDGVKTNNHLSNLEWVTLQENNAHAVQVLGKRRGMNSTLSKFTDDQIRTIRNDPRTLHAIAKDYGCYFTTIHKIKIRESWKHVTDGQ